MESQKTKGGEYNFGGLRWYLFNTYWRLPRCFQYKDSGARELGGLSFCSKIPCSTRRVLFRVLSRYDCMYECSKSNGNIVVKTKTTCYFTLDRVWNIHEKTTENSISRFLDFNIFWGSKLLQEPPRGSHLWCSQYFPLLRNIRISTKNPFSNPSYAPDRGVLIH